MTEIRQALLLLLFLCSSGALNFSNWQDTYPSPNSQHNRILAMILAFNLGHIDPMMYILNEYVSLCEGGWSPTVVLYTTAHWTDKLRRLIRDKTFCYRSNSSVPLEYAVYSVSIKYSLGAPHRARMARDIDKYDLFIYHEDDIVVKASHVAAYVEETKILHRTLREDEFPQYILGFQRYRRIFDTRDNEHRPEISESDIIEAEAMEEMPAFKPICLGANPYVRVEGNRHQAMFMLTRTQALLYNERCGFFNHSSGSREHMSSLFLYDVCKVTKIIPAARFVTFTVLHYYAGRHVTWIYVLHVDEGIKSNKHDTNVPACWADLVNVSIAEQDRPPSNYSITSNYSIIESIPLRL
jgi:hypothetical protein